MPLITKCILSNLIKKSKIFKLLCFLHVPKTFIETTEEEENCQEMYSSGRFGALSFLLNCCSSFTPLGYLTVPQRITFLSAGANCDFCNNSLLSDFYTSILKKLEKVPLFYFFFFVFTLSMFVIYFSQVC